MASKRGPLSKAEVFYIKEHVKAGVDLQQISVDLDRPIKSIEKCAMQAKKENKTSSSTNVLTAGQQMIKHKGAVVMTENASSISDARKNSKTSSTSNCITTIIKE